MVFAQLAIGLPIINFNNQTMSFLQAVEMDPHIHLYILDKTPKQDSQDQLFERIHHLMKTRRFDELLQNVQKLKDAQFPNLSSQLQAARASTAKTKKQLNDDDLQKYISKLDADSMNDDADTKELDEGQMKVYKLAKIYYDEGKVEKAYDIIKKLEKQGLNAQLYIKTTWARLYCEILLDEPSAKKTLEFIKKKIEEAEEEESAGQSNQFKPSVKKTHKFYARREEFLNFAVLVYFSNPSEEDYEKFVDLCNDKEYFSVVQLACPHLLRYICVALILNKTLHKNRQFDLFMLLEVIRRKVVKYSDPIIQYLEALNINYDFPDATEKLNSLRQCADRDPLLKPLVGRIIENCYFLFYKVYCKVYDRVPLQKIADFTGKTLDEAEMWILGFIRSLDIEAKIDSVEGVVISFREEESLNEKYMDLLPKVRGFVNGLKPSLN